MLGFNLVPPQQCSFAAVTAYEVNIANLNSLSFRLMGPCIRAVRSVPLIDRAACLVASLCLRRCTLRRARPLPPRPLLQFVGMAGRN